MACRPVQTSAVYMLGRNAQFAPPPSPPSPATNGSEQDFCAPIERLSLDGLDGQAGSSMNGVPPASPPATTADSPELTKCHPSYTSLLDASPSRLDGAIHVLETEAAALQHVAKVYATSPDARAGFDHAVDAILRTQTSYPPGKLVVVGVGKSGHIGKKLVATFNSLAVPASFLHPTEALHGDLGHIREHDALLFITYSGKSHELVSLLPHIDPALPMIVLTGRMTHNTCELVRRRNEQGRPGSTILLPAPIPVEEKVSFGVAAPTASTTTALAVGDALAIVASRELHPSTENVFRRNHPGGAIGQAFVQSQPVAASASASASASSSSLVSMASTSSKRPRDTVRHLAVPWTKIPVFAVGGSTAVCADILRAGYSSASGWVRLETAGPDGKGTTESVASPSRIRGLLSEDLVRPVTDVGSRLAVPRADLLAVAADTKLRTAAEWLQAAASASDDADDNANAIVSVMDHGEIVGVVELQELLAAA